MFMITQTAALLESMHVFIRYHTNMGNCGLIKIKYNAGSRLSVSEKELKSPSHNELGDFKWTKHTA